MIAVHLTLTAVGESDESIKDRTIILTKEKPFVDVGRSSKSLSKGLQAEKNNAIFDCPIVSRQHARFEMTNTPKASHHPCCFTLDMPNDIQEVTLKDSGSTHGTYINGKPVGKEIAMPLTTGEVVRFGTKIMNGPRMLGSFPNEVELTDTRLEVHEAKSFTTSFTFKPLKKVEKEVTSPSTGFRFPDEDEESIEMSENEGSVQVVVTNRNTYSVPSTDDEDYSSDEIDDEAVAESEQGNSQQVSAVTTPESKSHVAEAKKDIVAEPPVRNLPLKCSSITALLNVHDSQGSSQENPIEIESAATKPTLVINDTESEGEAEGPEIHPTRPLPSPPSRPSRPSSSLNNSLAKVLEDTKEKGDIMSILRNTVPETQPQDAVSNAAVRGDDPYESFEDHDEDEDLDEDDMSDVSGLSSKGQESLRSVSPDIAAPPTKDCAASAEKSQRATTPGRPYAFENTQDTRTIGDVLRASKAAPIDVSCDAVQDSYLDQRAPSPSDAALARKHTASQSGKGPILEGTHYPSRYSTSFDSPFTSGLEPSWRYFGGIYPDSWASPSQGEKTATASSFLPFGLVNDPTSDSQSHQNPGVQNSVDNRRQQALARSEAQALSRSEARRENSSAAEQLPVASPPIWAEKGPAYDHLSTPSSSNENRQTGHECPDITTQAQLSQGLFSKLPDTVHSNCGIEKFGHATNTASQEAAVDRNNSDSLLNQKSKWWSRLEDSVSSLSQGHQARGYNIDRPSLDNDEIRRHEMRDIEEGVKQQSRLNISSLINDEASSSQHHSLKRKLDDFESLEARIAEVSSMKDGYTVEEMMADGDPGFSTGEDDKSTFDFERDCLLQDCRTWGNPIISSNSAATPSAVPQAVAPATTVNKTTSAPTTESEEPPRKRTKASATSSKASGIAKFISGVAVGAVGVLAAIIATAPASVHEEALREVTNQMQGL